MTRPYRHGNETHFACGHPRTRANIVGRRECRLCCNARAKGRKTTFKCGHPIAENIAWFGKVRRCAICTAVAKTLRLDPVSLRDFAPRPLPVVDTSGRSYAQFPPKRKVG